MNTLLTRTTYKAWVVKDFTDQVMCSPNLKNTMSASSKAYAELDDLVG